VLTFRPRRLRLLGAHSGVQSSPIKEAAAQAGAALTAMAQAGAMTKGAAAQAGSALTATAEAGALPKGARALASDAGRLVGVRSSSLVAIPSAAFKKPLCWGQLPSEWHAGDSECSFVVLAF